MSRYYELTISDPKTGLVWKPDKKTGLGFEKSPGGVTFSSLTKSITGAMVNNPGALNIEFNFAVYPFNTAQGGAHICVWGVGLGMISQAAQLAGDGTAKAPPQRITLKAGMSKGLPLATAQAGYAGTILDGIIFQAYGNWQGTNQTLSMIVYANGITPDTGFCFFWQKGTQFSQAIASVLRQAMPTYKQKISVSQYFKLPHDEAGSYEDIFEFTGFVLEKTQAIGQAVYGPQYSGVIVTLVGDTILVTDNLTPPDPIQINFIDLIGQPTWIEPATINFKTVLRSDIAVGSQIKLPTQGVLAGFVLTTPAAAFPNAKASDKSVFQGSFIVTEVHHFANLRQPDGDSWATAFNAIPVPRLVPINLLASTLGL